MIWHEVESLSAMRLFDLRCSRGLSCCGLKARAVVAWCELSRNGMKPSYGVVSVEVEVSYVQT